VTFIFASYNSISMITTRDIQQSRLKRAKINHATYKLLYNMLATKIRSLLDVYPPVHKTTWKMPYMIPGRPLYQHCRALNYIRDKLAYGGFHVRTDDAQLLVHVSWENIIKPKHPPLSTDQLRRARQIKDEQRETAQQITQAQPNVLEMMANRAEELVERLRY